jgi:predicted nucleic acid-binding protein
MILVDTGPLVAAANRTDAHHEASVAAHDDGRATAARPGVRHRGGVLLLARDAGSTVVAEFLRSFTTGFLAVAVLTATDLGRSAELVEQYSNMPLGATDACLWTALGLVETPAL